MIFKKLTSEQKSIKRDREFVYAHATRLQNETWMPRKEALKLAWKELETRKGKKKGS